MIEPNEADTAKIAEIERALICCERENKWMFSDDGRCDTEFYRNARDYVRVLLAEVRRLHNQYAHEGGNPQVLTIEIARQWIAAIDVPPMTDIYQTSVPNVFYATFSLPLLPEHIVQIEALGFRVKNPNSVLGNRWMLKWIPPKNDEEA